MDVVPGYRDGVVSRYRKMDSREEEEKVPLSHPFEHENFGSSKTNSRASRYVMVCAIFASLNSVILGYDVGVMSGAILFIKDDLKITEVQEEVFVGILSIISLLGSLAGGKTSDVIGRKWTIALVFQSGVAVIALAYSFKVLMIGRFFTGIGVGLGIMIAPVYIAEIAPSGERGTLTSFPEIFINLGILLGYISNYIFSGLPAQINWRIMLGVGILPTIFIGLALCIIPESPRWLVMQSRVDEARIVLVKTIESTEEVDLRLAEIQMAAGLTNLSKFKEQAVWKEMLNPTPSVRRMLITGCGIQIFQQITGIDATVYYSPTIFQSVGIRGNSRLLAATVAVGFTKTSFILIAIFLIDRVGRKPLLFVSTIGMTVCLFLLGMCLLTIGDSKPGIALAIMCVCGNVAFFSVGIGPVCWVVLSEVFPLRLRAQASAIGIMGSRVSSGIIAMSFLSLTHMITVGGTFLVFAAISALSVIFVHKCVPETKGKSLEQIEMLFQNEQHWQYYKEVETDEAKHLMSNQ